MTLGGERVDQIAQLAYGFQNGSTEAIYTWNHGLADLPVELPAGIGVELPDLIAPPAKKSREVQLWG